MALAAPSRGAMMGRYSILGILFGLIPLTMAGAAPNIPLEKDVEPPQLLSQTGLLQIKDGEIEAAEGVIDYDIIQPLFVDYAQKQRFIYVPPKTKIEFSEEGPFSFPIGTVLVKHFRMELSKGVFQDLETRVLVRKMGVEPQSWVGYTYQWAGNDANLVDATSSPKIALSVDASAHGGAREQVFTIPNRRQCLQCHNSSVGYVRSFHTMQLNRFVGGVDQLEKFASLGLFSGALQPSQVYKRYFNIEDESAPLFDRVKSYAETNCAHCHNPDPAAMCNFTGLDFRYASFSVDALVGSGHLVRGSKELSEMYIRMDSLEPFYRMPFIGSVLRDTGALAAFGKWIDSIL